MSILDGGTVTTTGMVGADPDHLDSLAAAIDTSADAVEALGYTVRASLARTEWTGDDGDHFRQDWDSRHGPAITTTVAALRTAARAVRVDAAEQRITSNDATGMLPPGLLAPVVT